MWAPLPALQLLPGQKERPPLPDSANVWTLMGFWALLQAWGPQAHTALWEWPFCSPPSGRDHTHPASKIAWFALALCGHRCRPCLRCKQIRLLGPRCLCHSSLYTEVYFVLKLLAFCLFSKLTLQKWKLPHFYFNLNYPAESLI